MSKRLLALFTGALALTGCGNLAGPNDADAAANAARARQALEAAAQAKVEMSHRLSSN